MNIALAHTLFFPGGLRVSRWFSSQRALRLPSQAAIEKRASGIPIWKVLQLSWIIALGCPDTPSLTNARYLDCGLTARPGIYVAPLQFQLMADGLIEQ